MMSVAIELFLLMFGAIGFAGTGVAVAAAGARQQNDGVTDLGMLAVASLLFVFGSVCAAIGSGITGVLALGSVVSWVGYVVAAQRMGLFAIETGSLEGSIADETRQRT